MPQAVATTATAAAAPSPSPVRVFAGRQSDYLDDARQLVRHGMRNIAVIFHDGRFYAFDNACYHHGGALLRGDIEDMGGHPCIVCPWHSYRITMDTGEGLYVGVDPDPGGKPSQAVKSKGRKQRVYPVSVEADGSVYVEFSASGPAIESDTYASMAIANQEDPTCLPISGVGVANGRGPRLHSGFGPSFEGVRSGQVFNGMHAGGLSISGGLGLGLGLGRGGLSSPGRGGLNPLLGPLNKSPVPVCLDQSSSSAENSPRGSPRLDAVVVTCKLVEEVCAGIKQFSFICHSGAVQRNCELGEYVELELPIAGPDGRPLRRKWTVSAKNHRGTLFTVVVKCKGEDPAASGSAWLHRYGLHAPLRLCRVAGSFTMVDHDRRIGDYDGRVLWLTAGIGITSAYASLTAALTDGYYVNSTVDPLCVLHLHVDRTVDGVAKLRDLLELASRFPRHRADTSDDHASTKSYAVRAFLTREDPAGRPASGDSTTCSSTSVKRAKREKPQPLGELLTAAVRENPDCDAVFGARFGYSEIATATDQVFGRGRPFLALVCGPPQFVDMCSSALLSLGVREDDILTDDP